MSKLKTCRQSRTNEYRWRRMSLLRSAREVRIRGGALNGIEGILAAIKNDRSLVVSVDLIEKSVAIRIDGFEVERV